MITSETKILQMMPPQTETPAQKPPDIEPILLRGIEVAVLLRVSRAKAYRLMQRREIPVVMLGRSVRCPRESLVSFIRGRTELPLEGGNSAPIGFAQAHALTREKP